MDALESYGQVTNLSRLSVPQQNSVTWQAFQQLFGSYSRTLVAPAIAAQGYLR